MRTQPAPHRPAAPTQGRLHNAPSPQYRLNPPLGPRTADIDEMARVMGVVGEGTGEALNMEEIEDFKQQLGSEAEMKIDEFVEMLTDI
eukprot:COSAG06_NODE_108_length_23594_cov_43.013450_7_plen_88_part_00